MEITLIEPFVKKYISIMSISSNIAYLGNNLVIFLFSFSLVKEDLGQIYFINQFTSHSVHWGITPPHLLKVTRFLFNIFQFKFLVITEKNIFVYKLFFAIKYLRC